MRCHNCVSRNKNNANWVSTSAKDSHEKQDRNKENRSRIFCRWRTRICLRKQKMKMLNKFPRTHSAPHCLVKSIQKKQRGGKETFVVVFSQPKETLFSFCQPCVRRRFLKTWLGSLQLTLMFLAPPQVAPRERKMRHLRSVED